MTTSDELIPGVDYDIGCCMICGETEMHSTCDEFYGTYYRLYEDE